MPGKTFDGLLTRRIFLKYLGLIYFTAFVSLGVQVLGLIGSRGILPASEYLQAIHERFGPQSYWLVPTLAWFQSSDWFLQGLCWGGAGLSLLLILDLAPALVLFLLWLFYLSLVTAGQDFLSFQWDILLLETGFLAIFLAPFRLSSKSSGDSGPPAVIVWLLRWLLFRVMFSSGFVKLASGDPVWRNLTALTFHYQTQPLPTWIGWYAHQLPVWFQKISCIMMFIIELGVPFLIFAPRRPRLWGCGVLLGFQVLIFLTGNYCFFNLLTAALCLLLLDDRVFSPLTFFLSPKRGERVGEGGRRWPGWVIQPMAAAVILLSVMSFTRTLRLRIPWPAPAVIFYQVLDPLQIANGYGLFAVMTTRRFEIEVQGSRDGAAWKTYEFKYKPGNPKRRPGFVEPHQPRLDWQMWFAALGSIQRNPWFVRFCFRLLEGSPEILRLLAKNPFPDSPPRYVRALLYDYHFTDPSTRRMTGAWWRREFKGDYSPVMSLK